MEFVVEFLKDFWDALVQIIGSILVIFLFLYLIAGVLGIISVGFELPDRLARKKPAAPKATPARQSRCDCTKSEKG